MSNLDGYELLVLAILVLALILSNCFDRFLTYKERIAGKYPENPNAKEEEEY